MNKADYKAHRSVRQKVDNDARENEKFIWHHPQPIFIPKRKKKK